MPETALYILSWWIGARVRQRFCGHGQSTLVLCTKCSLDLTVTTQHAETQHLHLTSAFCCNARTWGYDSHDNQDWQPSHSDPRQHQCPLVWLQLHPSSEYANNYQIKIATLSIVWLTSWYISWGRTGQFVPDSQPVSEFIHLHNSPSQVTSVTRLECFNSKSLLVIRRSLLGCGV